MFDEKLNEFDWPFISLFLINQQRDSCEMLTEYMSVVKHGTIHVVRNRFFGLAPIAFRVVRHFGTAAVDRGKTRIVVVPSSIGYARHQSCTEQPTDTRKGTRICNAWKPRRD
jgi:hypothetical protein